MRMPQRSPKPGFWAFSLAFVLTVVAAASAVAGPKNVILLISDGAGFNTFNACSYYQYGQLGQQVYDGFPVQGGCTTWMLNLDGAEQGYDPLACWEDFNYVKGDNDYTGFTDSAAAATALYTGVKTIDGRISMDIDGNPLMTIAQWADAHGKSTGAISTVQFSHATPACVWAHNLSRNNYEAIANEMILDSGLDVIIGAGHPLYNDNGDPATGQSYRYVGGAATWEALVNGTTGQGWTLLTEKSAFEALAADPQLAPERLIGVPQVYTTFQYARSGSGMGNLNDNVPSLACATQCALHVLSQNPQGFFLMVEGGAVDWANHANDIERCIEEQIDFNHSVETVVDWVETYSNWNDTLVIVTADHECGMLWGAGTYEDDNADGYYDPAVDSFNFWYPVQNHGAGQIPGVQYGSGGHTNALVPLYAKGPGASRFRHFIEGRDLMAGALWGSRYYTDNVDLFWVMWLVLQY